jgi:ABC-2 type transport system permease protein
MMAIIIFILIIIGFNLIPGLTKKRFPKTEKIIERLLIYITLTFIILLVLSFNGIKLKGIYSNLIVGLIFILTSLLYFAINKNTTRKVISIVALLPLILYSFYFQFFYQNLGRYKVNEDLDIIVSKEGFLACGEIITLTKTKFILFDQQLIYDSNQCLKGIYKIETIEFNKKKARFLIFHSGKFDSENPYNYEINNINIW